MVRRLERSWDREGISRSDAEDEDSGGIKGGREFSSTNTKQLSIKVNRNSLSVSGVWAGLSSIPSYSTMTPTTMDGVDGSHTWSDVQGFASRAMLRSVALVDAGSLTTAESGPVCSGCSQQFRAAGWFLAGCWVGSGAGVVIRWAEE